MPEGFLRQARGKVRKALCTESLERLWDPVGKGLIPSPPGLLKAGMVQVWPGTISTDLGSTRKGALCLPLSRLSLLFPHHSPCTRSPQACCQLAQGVMGIFFLFCEVLPHLRKSPQLHPPFSSGLHLSACLSLLPNRAPRVLSHSQWACP